MLTRAKYPPLTMLLAGAIAILVSGVAIASLTFSAPERGLLSGLAETPLAPTSLAAATRGMRAQRMCTGCGVIQSTRKVANTDAGTANGPNTLPQGDEITVLLQDGSTRVIIDANPAKWKYGERVSIIAGIDG